MFEGGSQIFETVVVAWRVLPPSVVHVRRKSANSVMGELSATPFTFVLVAFRAVKSACCGLETVHSFMPEVTHPICETAPDATDFGFATRTIAGFATCMLQDADAERPLFVHINPKDTVFVPIGGAASVVLVAPESAPFVVNPLPTLTPAEHPHVIASVIPTSANCGWQES